MADANTETKTAAKSEVTATLVRGRYYDLNGKVWDVEKKDTHPVTPEEEAHLREHAFDRYTLAGEEQLIPKFKFSNDEPAPVRKRSR